MISSVFLMFGTGLLMLAMKVLFDENDLYHHGIKKRGKIVKLNSYSYIGYSQDGSKYYNYGINPLIEIDVDDKKTLVDYHSYSDMRDLNEGDEVEVIYPEGHVEELTRYSKYRVYKHGVTLAATAVAILVLTIGIIMI